MHRRAQARSKNLILGNAGKNELIDVCAGDVEAQAGPCARPASGWRREEPAIDQITFVPSRGEGVHQLRPHFITTGADVRPYRGNEILATRAELTAQRVDSCNGHARYHAPPSGVYGRNDTMRAIRHQKRDAVSSPDRDRNVWRVGDQRIRLGPRRGDGLARVNDDDVTAMHLRGHGGITSPHRFRERAHGGS